ncbi:hypothetical protein KEJ21_03390 [Candidatus Bathyarchaeota archaeon]|nr:hypothetical protein [Candidatus Bathyarchaeota archaeon]MBS7630272.1 hypothetical protein [Candidatus Bathyarchaeota archaeon]
MVKRRITGVIERLKPREVSLRSKTSTSIILAVLILFAAFIASGGLYDIFDSPPTVIGLQEGYLAFRGYLNEQTLLESIFSMILLIITFIGLYFSHRSTQIMYDSKRARSMLVMGIALTLSGVSGSFYMMNLKSYILRQFGI